MAKKPMTDSILRRAASRWMAPTSGKFWWGIKKAKPSTISSAADTDAAVSRKL
ncbi:MAG: hypothetical protein QOK43_1715 [Acidimicrobiaceae bacterium]|nr:hypothetical protein [Acidimicrobiaceae bacterium]